MKKLITVLLVLLTTISYAQDSAQASKDTSSLTWKTVYSDTKQALKGLGQALKVGTEHVYAVLIKQQMVNSIMQLIIIIGWIVLITFIIRFAKRTKEWGNWETGPSGRFCILAPLCVLSIGCLLYILDHLSITITGFVNPEYGAMKEILNFVKPQQQ